MDAQPDLATFAVPGSRSSHVRRVVSSGKGTPIYSDISPNTANSLDSGRPWTPLQESSARYRRRRRLACRSCRQAKIKCDIPETGSGRCKRCRQRNEECHTDVNFKRVNKRLNVDNLQQQSEQQSSAVVQPSVTSHGAENLPTAPQSTMEIENSDQTSPPTSSIHGILVSGIEADAETTPIINCSAPNSLSPNIMLAGDLTFVPESGFVTTTVRTLGDVSISHADETELFKTFFDNYHPFLSLLDSSISSEDYYERSPILFWVIISIASRNYAIEPTLITSLALPVMTFLWQSISAPPPTLHLVQAILLLCTWPFPMQTMAADLSFTLISIAKAFILQLGLHRPETVQDFLREKTQLSAKDIQEAVKVWAGCHITAQSVTVSIGQNPVCTVDWAIDRACQTGSIYELPSDLRHRLLIQQFSSNISQSMSANRQSPTGLPNENEIGTMLALLERNYDELHRQLDGNITDITRIMLSCSSLQLRAFYFFEQPELRQLGILKAYSTALSLINMTQNATDMFGFMLYSPSHFAHELLLGAVIVLKVLYSKFSTFVDFAEGKRAFNYAVSLLRKASIEDNDLNGRSSKILAQLWGAYNAHASRAKTTHEPSLRLRTRSSASVMHDELWAWRERFSKQSGSTQSSAPPRPPIFAPTPTSASGSSPEIITVPNPGAMGSGLMMDNDFSLDFDFDYLGGGWDVNIASLLPIDLDLYCP